MSACYVVQYNIACLGRVGMFAVKLLEFYVGHFTNREKLEGTVIRNQHSFGNIGWHLHDNRFLILKSTVTILKEYVHDFYST